MDKRGLAAARVDVDVVGVIGEIFKVNLFVILGKDFHIESQTLKFFEHNLERFGYARFGNVAALDDRLVSFNSSHNVVRLYGQYFLNAGYETYQTVLSFNGATSQLGVNEEAEETEGLLLLSSATEDFTGSYTVEPINQQNFTAGTVDAYNSSFYSYYGYYYVSDGYFKPNGGTLTVTKDGDNYIVEGVLTDDYPYGEPHKLTIHAVGQIASEEETETSSASSKKAVMHKTLSERRTLSAPRKAHNDYRITL